MDTNSKQIRFAGGAHSEVSFAQGYLEPHFRDGTITPYPGADYYAVCYGELCAYSEQPDPDPDPALAAAGYHHLLAIWSCAVPDCEEDVAAVPPPYAGTWEPY